MVVAQRNVVVGRQRVFRPYRSMELGKRSNSVQPDEKLVEALRSYSIASAELEKIAAEKNIGLLEDQVPAEVADEVVRLEV